MDSKVKLVKEFYRGLPRDRAKVETFEHGFEFLDPILARGAALEYGEMSFDGKVHKYKFSQVPGDMMDEFLISHVSKRCNLCLYFGDESNSLFCFNLDNNHKANNTAIIPEMRLAAAFLSKMLAGLGCEPLVIASGRGYHVWGRLEAPVENGLLFEFMLRAMARTLFQLHKAGLNPNRIKANFYPDPRSRDIVSLRLFGSDHSKNKVFSHVLGGETLLDEASSWKAFEDHLEKKTISVETFMIAHGKLMAPSPAPHAEGVRD